MPGRPTPIRIEEDVIQRLDAIAAAMTERAAGVKVARSNVIRLALERGMAVLEEDLGMGPSRTKKPKRK